MSIPIVERAQRHGRAVRWFARFGFTVLIVVVCVQAQQRGGTVQTDKVQPVNTSVNPGANPYRVIRDWATLSLENRPWGGSNGVAIDRDGKSVWATDRCSPGTTPGCLGTKANPVTFLTIPGRRFEPSAAGCSCGRMASMSIERGMCG